MKLAEPAWLLLLLLIPLFVIGAVLTGRLRRKQWAAFSAARLRPKLLRRGSTLPRWLAFSFLMGGMSLLAIGLARPQTTKGLEAETTKGRNVLFAIDLSRSMLAKDLKPDRLTQSKTLCYDLMEALPGDRIGVIGFAGSPYLVAPLTPDHAAVRETIDQLDTNFIPLGGTNLEDMLEMAIKILKETGQKENALIIMTDGDETTGRMMKLAQDAKTAGIYVFTIGMGTELGDFVPDSDYPDGRHRDRSGAVVRSALNAEPLKRMAMETGGRFAAATSATSIPEMVKLAISDMKQFEIAGRERFVPIEYYQWFVLPGILMLIASVIAGTRWRGLGPASTAVTAAFLMLLPRPAEAGVEADARRALVEGRHKDAATYFKGLALAEQDPEKIARYRLAEGNAAYLDGDLESARAAFSSALTSKDRNVRAAAHHGMGSVLFGAGWKRLSRDAAYPNVNPKEEQGRPNAFGRISDSVLGLSKEAPKTEDGEQPDPMETFDTIVRESLSEWMQSQAPESGTSAGLNKFLDLLSDWMDSVHHFDSALQYDPSLENARHNRKLTVKYLKRLREILEEVEENAEQLQPMPAPGEGEGQGPPQPGEGGEGDQEGEGQGQEDREGQGGEGDEQENDGEGGDRPDDRDGKGDREGDKDGGKQPKAGETPEEAASRILRENADFEKGALNPGRTEYRQPEKDW
ncbi:VWA domain-containing protein [Luteolibacter flavescens]|uniref:VWA domain-containing protein n=1 Tax=Luteolibacter flavescens TaxID=1859460 RepID=A0ABT3FIA3_9BACT|nr:VWA domain-containing protein [Luteolibacter flavescens]MCW1883290.1 VWA domain-containing protein [Luteolibacter flavescens]